MSIKKGLLTLIFFGLQLLSPSRVSANTATFVQGIDNYTTNASAYLDRWNPDANNGSSGAMWLRPENQYPIFRFDLSSLPENAVVNNAILKVFVISQSNANVIDTKIYEVIRPWNEYEVTWHKADNVNEWAWVGAKGLYADRNNQVIDEKQLSSSNRYYEYNITPLVRQWVKYPQTNFGALINAEPGGNVGYSIGSDNNTNPARRPSLIIDYSITPNGNHYPYIKITSPAVDSFITGNRTIDVQALDNDLQQIDYFLDGSYFGSSSTSPYSFTINANNYSIGKHLLTAKAIDNLGQTAESSINVNIYRTDSGILTIGQITDSHIGTSASYEPADKSRYYQNLSAGINDLNNIVKSAVILHTGDVATIFDNYGGNLYKDLVNQSQISIKTIAGNHDLSYPENFLYFTGPFNKSFDIGNNRFIGYSTTKYNPSWIQSLLASTNNQSIIFSHYLLRLPAGSTADPAFYNMPESEKISLQNLMSNYQVPAYLSGHLHTAFLLEDNISQAVEIGAPDIGSKGQYNIITVDRGVVSSQTIDIGSWPNGIMTYPQRYYPDGGTKEISGNQTIRVKTFGDLPVNLVVVRLDNNGIAVPLTNLGNNVWEKTLNVSAKGGGKHQLIFEIIDSLGRSKTFIEEIKVANAVPTVIPTPTLTPTAIPTATPTESPILNRAINSGGSKSSEYLADQSYTAVNGFGYIGGSTFSTTVNINNTDNPVIYQTERYGNFSYKADLPNGNYQVILKFAEIYSGCQRTDCRIFNVKIENNQVLTNFDIFKTAGGYKAHDLYFPVSVNDNQLNIEFITLKGNAKVSAIRITNSSEIPTPTPTALPTVVPTVTLTPTPIPTISIIPVPTITLIPTPTPTPTITPIPTITNPTLTPTLPPVSSSVVRINSGGVAYIDQFGNSWSADYGYSGGSLFSTTSNIANTNTPKIYQTERFNLNSYQIPVANGTYTVTLKFAEIYSGCQYFNCRIFNVKIENTQVLTNFDIFREAGGGYKTIDKTFSVNVADGLLNINFIPIKDSPKINGIEIY